MSNFSTLLRKLREKHGYTQEELGNLVGLHKRSIAKLEQGKTKGGPLWETVRALAKIFGVDCTAFENDGPTLPQARKGRPTKKKPAADLDPPPAEGGALPKKRPKE
jgi:DNA-binding XRE family transcriptional regulator